jgi:succinoglycan biosynthesis protein ExoO
MATVSVIVPNYNGQDFILNAIRTLEAQTFGDFEMIIVDDASTDTSREVISSAADKDNRIKPLFLTENSGPSGARNAALEVATGKWVTLLDSDDLYAPQRLEKLTAIAEKHDADVVADNQSVRDFGSSTHVHSAFPYLSAGEIVDVDRRFFFLHSWDGYHNYDLGLLKPMFKLEFLKKHNIRYDRRYRIGEDYMFYAQCVLKGAKFIMLGDDLYIYHRRPGSISRLGTPAFAALAEMCDVLLNEFEPLIGPAEKRLLTRRRQGLKRVVAWREARRLKREKDWKGLFALLATSPISAYDLAKMSAQWRIHPPASNSQSQE